MKSPIRIAIAHHDCSFREALRDALVTRHGVSETDLYEIELVQLIELVKQRSMNAFTDCLLICANEINEGIIEYLQILNERIEEPIAVFSVDFEKNEALNCIRSGAIDCIEMRSASHGDLSQLLDRLQSNSPGRIGKLASVISCGGGSGASFLCKTMAQLLCQRQSIGLLDFNLFGGDLHSMLVSDTNQRSNSLISHGDRVDEDMFEQSIQRVTENLYLLASDVLPEIEVSTPRTELMLRISEYAKQQFKFSIADIAVGNSHLAFAVHSDMVILVTRPNIPGVYRLSRMNEQLQQTGIDAKQIHVIVNQVTGQNELSIKEIEKISGISISGQLRFDAETANAAINTGLPIEKSKLLNDVQHVVRQIFGQSTIEASPKRHVGFVSKKSAAMFAGLLSIAGR